jgi:hypothetical protein
MNLCEGSIIVSTIRLLEVCQTKPPAKNFMGLCKLMGDKLDEQDHRKLLDIILTSLLLFIIKIKQNVLESKINEEATAHLCKPNYYH